MVGMLDHGVEVDSEHSKNDVTVDLAADLGTIIVHTIGTTVSSPISDLPSTPHTPPVFMDVDLELMSPAPKSSISPKLQPKQYSTRKKKAKKRGVVMAPSSTRKRAKKGPNYDADYVIQDPKSPLAYADLRALFANPESFSVLDMDEKLKLLSLLPQHDEKYTSHSGSNLGESSSSISRQNLITLQDGQPEINVQFLNYDPDWRHALVRFQEDIIQGRNDPEWLSEAITASKRRASGEFDDFKEKEYEEFWGLKQKLPYDVIAGATAKVKLEDLFLAEILRPGDIFSFCRNFRETFSSPAALVEKEATVINFQKSPFQIKVSYPPGQLKHSNTKEREDIVLSGDKVVGPAEVAKALINEDGRILAPPVANAWKLIRVIRNNQDLGTLWDLRQALHFGQTPDDEKDELGMD